MRDLAERFITVAGLLAVVCVSSAACEAAAAEGGEVTVESSQPVSTTFEEPFSRRHDQGGLFRLELGGAFISPAAFESAGFSGAGQLAAGWLPWPRVGVHATGWAWGTDTRGIVGLGPGMTLWFSETGGWYASWAAGLVNAFGSDIEGGYVMLGGEITFGIQGWIGERWSMGGAAFVGGEAFPVYGSERSEWSLNRARAGLKITLTFN